MAGITDKHEWHGFNSFLNNAMFPWEVWATLTTRVQDKAFLSLFLTMKTVGYGDFFKNKSIQTREESFSEESFSVFAFGRQYISLVTILKKKRREGRKDLY